MVGALKNWLRLFKLIRYLPQGCIDRARQVCYRFYMKRFAHGLFALVLLVVSTCTTLRAEAQPHEKKASSACPLHSEHSDDSQPASQTCAHCLSSHFVSESKIHFAVAPVAVVIPLHAVYLETATVTASTSESAAPDFPIDTSPRVLRI